MAWRVVVSLVAYQNGATFIREAATPMAERLEKKRPKRSAAAMTNFQRIKNGRLRTDWLAMALHVVLALCVVAFCIGLSAWMGQISAAP